MTHGKYSKTKAVRPYEIIVYYSNSYETRELERVYFKSDELIEKYKKWYKENFEEDDFKISFKVNFLGYEKK